MSEAPERQANPLDLLDAVAELLGQKVAARDDAHEREVVAPLVSLEDLVGDAGHGRG